MLARLSSAFDTFSLFYWPVLLVLSVWIRGVQLQASRAGVLQVVDITLSSTFFKHGTWKLLCIDVTFASFS